MLPTWRSKGVKPYVPFGLKPCILSNKKIKVSNFYKTDKVKSGEDVNVKCVRPKNSEKGKRHFK